MPKEIQIRPARAADKAAVASICAQTWEGDYVPEVWDEWLADSHGQFVVAEAEGRAVGLGKLTRLAAGEWWLEGLRVDPDWRRQGIAGRIQAHVLAAARRLGGGVLRYGTHSANEAVHRISDRLGFRRAGVYQLHGATPLPAAAPSLRQLAWKDLEAAWALVEGSERRRAAGGLYEVAWKWMGLTRERLSCHVAAGEAWGVYGNGNGRLAGLALVWWGDVEQKGTLHAGYVDGVGEAELARVLLGLRDLAAQRGLEEGVGFKSLEEPALLAAAGEAGYAVTWDKNIWVFEQAV